MKSYTASVTKADGRHTTITSEYNTIRAFLNDLRANGYKVRYSSLTENFEEATKKYYIKKYGEAEYYANFGY